MNAGKTLLAVLLAAALTLPGMTAFAAEDATSSAAEPVQAEAQSLPETESAPEQRASAEDPALSAQESDWDKDEDYWLDGANDGDTSREDGDTSQEDGDISWNDQTDGADEVNYSPVVTLEAGKENGWSNFWALRDALDRADGEHDLVVTIEKPGTYYLDSGGSALMLHSRTTLDLNGSTLIRSGEMYNLIQVETLDGARSVAAYTAAHDVTVKNGTLDGSGNRQPGKNLVNVGHSEGLTFSNLTMTNCQNSHLMELNGCRDCLITGCTFSGYDRDGSENYPEAIQLDIAYNGAGDSWNGVYCEPGTPGMDNTVCQNITVENCQFKDYPSGVGNHHCLFNGPRNKNIVIRNNTFSNAKSFGKLVPAVWCYGFENSEVSGNTISGAYSHGIRFSGGSVAVKKNIIGSASKVFSGQPILVTYSDSHVKGSKDTRKHESVTGGSIDGNQLFTSFEKSKEGAITISGGSKLSSVSGNTVRSDKGSGIYISASSQVKNVNKNTVTKAAKGAIYLTASQVTNLQENKLASSLSGSNYGAVTIYSKSKVGTVTKNQITSTKGAGFTVGSSSTVTTMSNNTIQSPAKSGIYVGSKGTVTNVTGNTVTKGKANGIEVVSSGKVSKVTSNKVTGCKGIGIRITNKSLKVTVQKNVLTGNKKPLQVTAKGSIQKK